MPGRSQIPIESSHEGDVTVRTVILTVLLGCVVRLFVCLSTFIINQDGVLYVHQARALFYGQWDSVTSCGLSYLSPYPLCIAGAYFLVQDWTVAARGVSLVFGSAVLIPVFLLFRRFFDRGVSVAGLLIYATIPVLVSSSSDALREPVCWFFLAVGLYLFVSWMQDGGDVCLVVSGLAFIFASWARIEAFVFIPVSCLFVLISGKGRRIRRVLLFLSPLLSVTVFVVTAQAVFDGSLVKLHRGRAVVTFLGERMDQYRMLRGALKDLSFVHGTNQVGSFLHQARNLVWVVALGALVKCFVKALFYPVIPLVFMGVGVLRTRMKAVPGAAYLTVLAGAGLLLLYVNLLGFWLIYPRFMGIVIFPCVVLVGAGADRLLRVMGRSRYVGSSRALQILCLVILATMLPKNMYTKEADKVVFKDIGTLISTREGSGREILVSTSGSVRGWITFYANLDRPGAPCPQGTDICWESFPDGSGPFLEEMREKNIRYFLWDEKHWPAGRFDAENLQQRENVIRLGAWFHPDTGRMILYELRDS